MGITTLTGVIYFGHGARDIRWREPFDRLKQLWQSAHPEIPCELAFLEMMTPSLTHAIQHLVDQNIQQIKIIPVFFGQGGHLRKDFPILLEEARAQFPNVALSASCAVGESDLILQSILGFTIEQIR
ncbi:sirohydrochlorin chelatase [Polynucleobacter kasalickyi]|uniref:Sirohydrochlorin cobaltochelatase n=1 Tax=Polynucleobacter kasalickyi TaxID=1938817 RepID=A0A1W1ZN78_9BURK|nr:CbiX/SirB N-terminal domain-containing protein [Polynucleobacter kasalickyi]SMC49985.1 sirohydrochlorin cobaltochelatase [Polynucleobacter kasalickyi]